MMVDFDAYSLYGPDQICIGELVVDNTSIYFCCADCQRNSSAGDRARHRFNNATGYEDEAWEDLQYMLCPPRLLGYVLKSKQWAQLDVDRVIEVTDDADAFRSKLQLRGDGSMDGQETKDLLMSLVQSHGQGQIVDLVEDKGKGLVVLLYGQSSVCNSLRCDRMPTKIQGDREWARHRLVCIRSPSARKIPTLNEN